MSFTASSSSTVGIESIVIVTAGTSSATSVENYVVFSITVVSPVNIHSFVDHTLVGCRIWDSCYVQIEIDWINYVLIMFDCSGFYQTLGPQGRSPSLVPPHGTPFHLTSLNLESALQLLKKGLRLFCSDKCCWVSSFLSAHYMYCYNVFFWIVCATDMLWDFILRAC